MGVYQPRKKVLSCIIPLYGYVIPKNRTFERCSSCAFRGGWMDIFHILGGQAQPRMAGGLGCRVFSLKSFWKCLQALLNLGGYYPIFWTPKKIMGSILKNQVMYCIWRPHGSAAGVGWNMPWHSTRHIQEWMLHIKRKSYMVNWFSEMSELFLLGLCPMLRPQENSDPTHFFTSHC